MPDERGTHSDDERSEDDSGMSPNDAKQTHDLILEGVSSMAV